MQRNLESLITKLNKRTKTTPKGKNKQAGRQAEDWSTVKHLTHMTWTHERQRISTGLHTAHGTKQTTSHVLNTQRHLVASLGTPAGP